MISVAMCTYNGSKYLAEQLNSIIHQSLQPDEIVICDDCSKDNTVVIAKEVLKNWNGHSQIVVNEHNLGFIKNFEKAIGLCHGNIIFLSDQDDVWSPDKIELMVRVFDANPNVFLVFHDAEIVDSKLNTLYESFWKTTLHFDYRTFQNLNYTRLYESNVVQGSACAFRREVYNRAIPFITEAFHDEWLALVASTLGKIYALPRNLMKYRQDNNALGGLPTPLRLKVSNFIKKLPNKYSLDLKNLKNRHTLMTHFVDRYKSDLNPNTLELEEFTWYLEKRIDALQHLNLKNICSFKKYKKFYPFENRAFLIFSKDILEIVGMKILK